MTTRFSHALRGAFTFTAALLLLVAGFATTDVHASILTVRCVTTSGTAPPVATASGCAALYSTLTSAIAASIAGDTIYVFADPGATATNPTLYSTSVTISTNLTIIGVGAVALDGGTTNTVIFVGSGTTVTLIGLTIQHGNATTSSGGFLEGGGIYNSGTLTLIGVTIANNTAGNDVVSDGGGIYNVNGATLTTINTTVANNTAVATVDGEGGGIENNGTMTLIHTTVARNTAQGNSGGGGGISEFSGSTTTLINSLVAGNTGLFPADINAQGGILSTTNSVVGGVTPNATTGLGTLADNGGPTQTVSIAATSPAHDNAACATNPTTTSPVATDQRDLLRPQGATCDAGAFELTAGPTPPAFPVSITTTSLPLAITNVPYNQSLATTNGSFPSTYTLLAGTLPGTITLAPAGTLSGTASTAGSFPFTVGVSDAGQFMDIRALTLTVAPAHTSYTVGSVADDAANPPAATFTDCTSGTNTDCTLRDALFYAVSGTDTVQFNSTGQGTITLTNGTLTVGTSVTITGPGAAALTISGNSAVTVFAVNSGTTVALSGMTITNGKTSGNGGGIANLGTLSVTTSTLSGNSGSNGGGIYNAGTLSVTNSTLSGNSATGLSGVGGGIENSVGTVTVTNSTFSGNSAPNAFGGGLFNFDTLSVTNSTLSGNTAAVGGGIDNEAASPVTLTNTIVAASGRGGDLTTLTSGTFTGTHNLVDDRSAITGTGNLTHIPALLGPLGAYGSTNGTQTFALLPGSPALEAGDDPTCQATGVGMVSGLDQRGITRPQPTGGHCDIGAFEARFTLTISGGNTQSASVMQPFAQPLAVTFGGADAPAPPRGARVTFTVNPVAGATATLGTPNPATTNASGVVSVTATANGTTGSYTVTASMPGALSVTFTLTNGAALTLSPTNPPDGVKNIAYTPNTMLTATGGTSPYTFMVTAGSLPPGLTLNPNGALTGTPTMTGAFTFTVTATDANGLTGTQQYTITITPAALVSIAVTPAAMTLKVGQTQIFTATGTYADNSTLDLSNQVTWSSDATGVASVDASGKVTAATAGTAHIKATQGSMSGQTTVTVSAPTPIGIAPAPAPSGRASGAGSSDGTSAPNPAPVVPQGNGPTPSGTAPAPLPTGR